MCGIVGFRANEKAKALHLWQQLPQAAASINYRGPDDQSFFNDENVALACNRLAIVDVGNGHQPIFNEDKSIVTIFNGELYNHAEIRETLGREGHRFDSNSDGAILPHLYETYGAQFVTQLEGQFAIAIWDKQQQKLVLARDHFGICPLHYSYRNDVLAFASEAKAIYQLGSQSPKLDVNGLAHLFTFGTPIAPRTIFEGIRSLQPGHQLICDKSGITIKKYYDIDFPAEIDKPRCTAGYFAKGIKKRLLGAVDQLIPSEVPFGVFLSGGIDSGSIASITQKISQKQFNAYTIATPSHKHLDESKDAQWLADHLNIPLHKLIADDLAISEAFKKMVWHGETPVSSTESAALGALAQKAAKDVKVILTGEGADEAFGGYMANRMQPVLGKFWHYPDFGLRSFLGPAFQHVYGSQSFLPEDTWMNELKQTLGFVPAQAMEWQLYREVALQILDPVVAKEVFKDGYLNELGDFRKPVQHSSWQDKSLYIGYKVMLANYLLGPHGDRALMSHSVEGRYPYLNRKLVDYVAAIPNCYKSNTFISKQLQRAALVDILPKQALNRPKVRFMTPFGSPFLQKDTPELIKYVTQESQLRAYGYFKPDAFRKLKKAVQFLDKRKRKTLKENVQRLGFGVGLNFMVSLQLLHFMFLEQNIFEVKKVNHA